MYQTILFDLDGTLTDSGRGIINAAAHGLEAMGHPIPDRQTLYKFIGPPLHESLKKFCRLDEAQAEEVTKCFRSYYEQQGIFENELYPGVIPMLSELKAQGKRLVLATSKPEKFARVVMHHFGLDSYIPEIAGASMGKERSYKDQVIAYALREFGIDPADTVMVGDRKHDILGAKENGLPGIGVTYGYGDRGELEDAGAAAVVDTTEELTKLLLRG